MATIYLKLGNELNVAMIELKQGNKLNKLLSHGNIFLIHAQNILIEF